MQEKNPPKNTRVTPERAKITTAAPRGAVEPLSGGAFYAQTILDRHAIPLTERSRLVQRIFGLAYSAAHRRVRGQASWTIEELEVLASHFGETLDQVFIAAAKMRADSATLVAGELRLKCQLWLGAQTLAPTQGELVATREGQRWTVVAASENLTGPVYEVRQLLMEPHAIYGSRVAVLDDEASVTESLGAFLRQAGFRADAFHGIDALRQAAAAQPYDGYVLDWIVGDTTVGKLVELLRATDARCPIAVFAGKNERGDGVAEIADLVAKHDVRYFSKPLDPQMIVAVLTRLVAARSQP
jgi:CheY-like chemotaxis protein